MATRLNISSWLKMLDLEWIDALGMVYVLLRSYHKSMVIDDYAVKFDDRCEQEMGHS